MFSARRVATAVPLIGHPFYFQAAKIYFSLNNTDVVSIDTLKNNDYFDENKVSKLKNSDEIRISDSGYTFNGKSISEASCSE